MPLKLGRSIGWTICVIFLFGALSSCKSGDFKRGPGLDGRAMSLKLDKTDLDKLYAEAVDSLLGSKIVETWEALDREGDTPVVAIFPMRNETSEHIGPQLDTLLGKFETDLVNKTSATVISKGAQSQLINEIKQQQSDAYNPERLASYGEQLGAQYYVTGKVRDVAERVEGERRVQYFMFLQVLEVSTAAIKFQYEADLTKGFVK